MYQQLNAGYLEPEWWEARARVLPTLVELPIYEAWRNSPGGRGQPVGFLELLDAVKNGE